MKTSTTTYWLHVHDDGTEQRFATEPTDIPNLRVEIIKVRKKIATERTWTKRVFMAEDVLAQFGKIIPPRGVGWIHERAEDGEYSDRWIRTREVM